MTASDVRDCDPGDGRLSTPSTTRPSAWSADVRRTTTALPPLAPDRGQAPPDWFEVVEHFREGLVVCDADGVVRHVSPVAERLLPEVTSGEPLSSAGVPGLSEDARGGFTQRGRRLTARRVPLSGARCCWYVEDVTDSVSRADALLAERARSAFLAVVGDKLGNPLHPDRAAAAVVR
ncbi:serine/threonine-protein phosphatase, partial [Micromonospora sp. M51]|nr:serine/threonine-protein phosphatase [Micromonospora sp. M51]